MRRATAQSTIDTNRFEMGSKNNPTTVAGEAIRDLRTDDSRGTEAATAASARAVQQRDLRHPIRMRRDEFRIWISAKEPHLATNFFSQLNFEFLRSNKSMNVFTIHLGRVYRACFMKERIDFAVGLAAGNSLQNR
jgi:hypothetical protein